MVHSVFSALAEHPVTRYAKFIYFPEAAPADAGKRMFAYAKKWNARYAGGSPKIAVVHEGGLGENRQPLPGCRKTHDITETGVNHLRLQMQQGTVKRLDTMIYLTNLDLGPGKGVVRPDVLERHVLNTQTKEQFMRFMKRNLKTSHEYADERYVYSGKAGALQDDLVVPFIMQSYWLDVLFGSTSAAWQAMSAKRKAIVTEQPRFIPTEYMDEINRLKNEGIDIGAPKPSLVTSQARPLPFNATAMHTEDTRQGEWAEFLPENQRANLRQRRATMTDERDRRTPAPINMGAEAFTLDFASLALDNDDGSIVAY